MQGTTRRKTIGGAYPGAKTASIAGEHDPTDRIECTVIIRPANPIPKTVTPFQHLSRKEFAKQYGATAQDLADVASWAKAHGLEVTGTSSERRSVFLAGGSSEFDKAFEVQIALFDHPEGVHRGFHNAPSIPEHLGDIVMMVIGLHNQPIITKYAQERLPETDVNAHVADASPAETVDTALQRLDLVSIPKLEKFYDFPDFDGAGECIGIIEMGPGCGYYRKDLEKFFAPVGKVDYEDVCIGEAENAPVPEAFIRRFANWSLGKGGYQYAAKSTAEVTMDVSLIGALVPKAKILVYFCGATEQALLHMIQTALFVSDPQPSVISISWGFQEREIIASGDGYMGISELLDELFLSAAHLGVTICAAAGDWGASNTKDDSMRNPEGLPDVEFPASSPHVLACGGTTILQDDEEVVWNADFPPTSSTTEPSWIMHGATGGGFSQLFKRPPWQAHMHTNDARGLPDVAAVADPRCGARFVLAGLEIPFGGTSSSAPIWAALALRLNQALSQRVGWLNPSLYRLAAGTEPDAASAPLKDVTKGNNRFKPTDKAGFTASKGWDACSGLGTPRGQELLAALRRMLAAG